MIGWAHLDNQDKGRISRFLATVTKLLFLGEATHPQVPGTGVWRSLGAIILFTLVFTFYFVGGGFVCLIWAGKPPLTPHTQDCSLDSCALDRNLAQVSLDKSLTLSELTRNRADVAQDSLLTLTS